MLDFAERRDWQRAVNVFLDLVCQTLKGSHAEKLLINLLKFSLAHSPKLVTGPIAGAVH